MGHNIPKMNYDLKEIANAKIPNTLTLEEFEKHCTLISKISHFNQKLYFLKSICCPVLSFKNTTKLNKTSHHLNKNLTKNLNKNLNKNLDKNTFLNTAHSMLNIKNTNLDLKLVVTQSSFESNIVDCYRTLNGVFQYFFLFDNLTNAMLLQLRISLDGYWGELIWFGRGLYVSGGVLMRIFKCLIDSFQVFLLYLLDDSRIHFEVPINSFSDRFTKKQIALRVVKL